MRRIVIVTMVLALAPTGAALAANDGCDIATTSYVQLVPPTKGLPPAKHSAGGLRKAGLLRALPQTPCPTVPNGCREGEACNMPIELNISPNLTDPAAPAAGADMPAR
jgi:hypothetical protein